MTFRKHISVAGDVQFFLGLVVHALILYGCSSSLPVPREEDVKKDAIDLVSIDELFHGRSLYVAKCSGCHSLYLPKQYSTSGWDTILAVMNPKAKVTDAEANRIRTYLTTYSSTREE